MCRQTGMLRMTGRCVKTNALVSDIVLITFVPGIVLTAGISLTTLESGILLNLRKRFETVFRPVYRATIGSRTFTMKNACLELCAFSE
jgi:hypothetical protein